MQRRWKTLSLRQQIIVCLWLCMLPTSLVGSVVIGKAIFERGRHNLEQKIVFGAASVSQIINDWLNDGQMILQKHINGPGNSNTQSRRSTGSIQKTKRSKTAAAITLYKLNGESA